MVVKTPPMGWNSWNTFGADISEDLIIETCDAMIENGLLDAGYNYVVIDDCWSLKERDKDGNLVPDPKKFPHGMKYLADYIHSKGMKFGMYSCAAHITCAGYPGSFEHEYQDAKFFAENGVDLLKYDFCSHPSTVSPAHLYNRMSMALRATGRDILFSICNWGTEDVYSWAREVGGDMYRSTADINDNFGSIRSIYKREYANMCLSGPSCFNDMDMLVIGMYNVGNVAFGGGCNDDEYLTHFAIWCMMSQPLMIGCDVRNMTEATKNLLLNRELIDIDQDPEVRPPFHTVAKKAGNEHIVLMKHLANGEYAFLLTNMTDDKTDAVGFWLPEMGLSCRDGYGFKLRDVMTGEDLGIVTDMVTTKGLGAHCSRVLRGPLVKI